jgi:LuxR family maltose regulon positive regulatory protein
MADENTFDLILRTKLHRPPLFQDALPRPHRAARLDELRRWPLTLVSSAAGYGKSTMASLWLEAWDGPCAWVSLDEEENDLHMFLSYLLAAIRQAIPGACAPTSSLLQAHALPPWQL